ncbi:MAG TPA: ATP-binding protein [Steroidobacteraceae bacterium]|nr:ATP-binding protein [Steroidobacteraceae bacterium]
MSTPNASSTRDSSADLSYAVEPARLQFVMRGLPVSLASALTLALITVMVMWSSIPHPLLIGWIAVFTCVTAFRAVTWTLTRTAYSKKRPTAFWRACFVGGCALSGLSWGTASILFNPTDPFHAMFMAIVIAGTAAASITSLAADKWAAYALVLPTVMPFTIDKLLSTNAVDVAVGAVTLLFVATLSGSIARLHEQILVIIHTRAQLEISQTEVSRLNERMRMATHVARAGIYEWDLITRKADWDARVYEMWDLDPSTPATLEVWQSRVHPADLAATVAQFQRIMKTEKHFDLEFRVLSQQGVTTDIRSRGQIVRDANGTPIQMIGLVMDITELRKLDRMKQEFVSMVSHELRTPLTSIRGALGLLTSGGNKLAAAQTTQLFDLANRNAERLALLIDDILDMDKIESGKMRFNLGPEELNSLLEQALASNAAFAAGFGVSLALSPSPIRVGVFVDPHRFQQIMTNVLSNAAKFSPPGASVEVSAEVRGAKIRIDVRDHGPGIPAEFHSKIFGKFCQGDSSDSRNKGGSGLGLAISKALIEAMQGMIGFETSKLGTTFHIEFPVIEGRALGTDSRISTTIALDLDAGR